MPGDLTRTSDDVRQQYRGLVFQQGRVTVDRDYNALQEIIGDRIKEETLDVIGPAGTPDDGFRISLPSSGMSPPGSPPLASPPNPAEWDFLISPGTMYLGGERAVFRAPSASDPPISYDNQPDWLAPDPPPASPVREFIYLHVFEQEVSATEDDDLREVALGGPDTTGRLRLIQRVKRLEVPASDCADALKSAVTQWGSLGYDFDPATMRLRPRARLQAGYAPPESPPNLCEPTAQGGYLGADNQLIRVQIALDPSTGTPYLLWGFDNAAFLFQVEQIGSDNKTLTLLQVPVDAYHFPAANQTVEVLKSGLKLANGRYVAEATGFVATLAQGYKGGSIQLADALAGFDLTEPVYVRIWQDRLAFTPGVPVALGSTGLLVTITPNANGTSHGGDYWMIAVRPSTPQEVYPERLLNSPQPPDGPRQWVCPLAVIDWRTWQVSDQCRNCFDHLIDLCHRDVGGCCTVSVRPEDLTGTTTLQTIINGLASTAGRMNATVCLMPGTFELSEPLRLDSRHDYLTIEACHDGAVLRARPGSEANFADGLIVLERANCVTIRGLRLEPPPVSAAGRSAGWANLLASSASAKELLRINESLHTSIAIRSVHCAVLRVEGCLFRFSLMPANPNAPLTNVFSVGVFANGPTWGLTLDGNRFIREEKYLRSTRQLFRLICGFLIAPAVQPAPRSNVGASTSASTVLPAPGRRRHPRQRVRRPDRRGPRAQRLRRGPLREEPGARLRQRLLLSVLPRGGEDLLRLPKVGDRQSGGFAVEPRHPRACHRLRQRHPSDPALPAAGGQQARWFRRHSVRRDDNHPKSDRDGNTRLQRIGGIAETRDHRADEPDCPPRRVSHGRGRRARRQANRAHNPGRRRLASGWFGRARNPSRERAASTASRRRTSREANCKRSRAGRSRLRYRVPDTAADHVSGAHAGGPDIRHGHDDPIHRERTEARHEGRCPSGAAHDLRTGPHARPRDQERVESLPTLQRERHHGRSVQRALGLGGVRLRRRIQTGPSGSLREHPPESQRIADRDVFHGYRVVRRQRQHDRQHESRRDRSGGDLRRGRESPRGRERDDRLRYDRHRRELLGRQIGH